MSTKPLNRKAPPNLLPQLLPSSLPQGFPLLGTPPIPKRFTPPSEGEEITTHGRSYRLGKALGNGHFGAVFECTDVWGNELVAKVLLPQKRSYETVREDWLREIESLVQLRNPFITHVFDAFEYRDTFYLIIERCAFSLRDLIVWPELQGALWLKPVARCVLQAVHFMHSAGYVHKDIHPGNILTRCIKGEMGEPNTVMVFKVGDLGISRLEPDIRLFNTVLAEWMLPPEFLNPQEFGRVCKTVDIYHSGLVFLSLLLQRIPTFTREEVIAGVPRQVAEGLNSPFSPALSKALRRHTGHRTQTALEFWSEINRCVP